MPLIQMYFAKGMSAIQTDEQRAQLCRKITDLVVQEAKVPQHATWVVFNEIPAENWMIDRMTLPEFKAKLMAEKK